MAGTHDNLFMGMIRPDGWSDRGRQWRVRSAGLKVSSPTLLSLLRSESLAGANTVTALGLRLPWAAMIAYSMW